MNASKGFTLLEVLIGMAILVMMSVMIWQISSGSLDTQQRVEKRDEIYQMARVAVQRVADDVNMAFLVTNEALLGKTRDGSNVETAFIGDDKGDFDQLDFNSMSHWRMFQDAREADQTEVGYFVEKDQEDSNINILVRREDVSIDNDVTKDGKAYPMAEGISEFKLEYYDGKNREWTPNWNSREVDRKGTLPRAVKITLSFPDPEDEEAKITFETIALIELWQYPIDF